MAKQLFIASETFPLRLARRATRQFTLVYFAVAGFGLAWGPPISTPPGIVYALALMVPGLGLWALYFLVLFFIQRWRNKRLEKVLADLLGSVDEATPLFLYLRSFNVAGWTFFGKLWHARRAEEFLNFTEQSLSEALDGHGMFLAIGNKEFSFGAAKIIGRDHRWQDDFHVLSSRASLIFFVPGATNSAMWEADKLLNNPNLLSRTVWISASHIGNKEWSKIRSAYKASWGIDFPELDPDGVAFVVKPNKTCLEVPVQTMIAKLTLGLDDRAMGDRAFTALLDDIFGAEAMLADVVGHDRPNSMQTGLSPQAGL